MPPARSLLLAGLLLAAPLAGCLGAGGEDAASASADEDSLDAETGPQDPEAADGEANRTPLAFDGSQTRTTVWFNDTFAPQENCYAGGCATGSAAHEIPIEGELPESLPARVTATLSHDDEAPVLPDPIELGLFAQDASIYTAEWTSEDGVDEIAFTTLVDGGSVTLQVFYEWLSGAEPETSYALEVQVEAGPQFVPPGAVAAVELAPGDAVSASAVGEGPAALELRGPEDVPVDRASSEDGAATVSVPEEGSAGEHVLVVPDTSSAVQLETAAEASSARPLPLAAEALPPREATPGQTLSFEEDVQPAPVAVAAYTVPTDDVGVSATEGSVTVEAPDGTVIDGGLGCNLCLTIGFYESAWSDTGAAELAAGTYTVTYEPGAEAGWEVGLMVASYQR